MKTFPPKDSCSHRKSRNGRGEEGFVVIALMAILAIMLIYINVNMRVLYNLKRDLRLIEQKQIQRLEKTGIQVSRWSDFSMNLPPAPAVGSIAP